MEKFKEMVDWLVGVEGSAKDLYDKAAALFQDDAELSTLLKQLSADELLHYELMVRAGEYLTNLEDFTPVVSLDKETRKKVEKPFAELLAKVESGAITRRELVESAITLEFTELNHFFMYVMDSLKENASMQFASAALNVEQHKDRIRAYINGRPGFQDLIRRVGQLPVILRDKILVVDDMDVNLSLFKAVLDGEGIIEDARNGEEALKKVESNVFSVILSDVEMPIMDGIQLYLKAVEKFPELRNRFLFITASTDAERIHFFRNHNLRFLTKPAPISEIRRSVREILQRH